MFERDLVNLPQEPSCRRVQFGLSALELELRTYAWIHIQGVGLILESHRPVKTASTVEVLPHRFELIPFPGDINDIISNTGDTAAEFAAHFKYTYVVTASACPPDVDTF